MKKLSKLAAILAVSVFIFGGLLVSCSPHGTGIYDGQSAGGGGAGGGGTDGGGAGGGGGPIATYTVTYDDGVSDADISVPSDTTRYKTGDTVTVKFDGIGTRAGGYTFKGWKKGSETYTSTGTKTFTMGSENVTLTAQWKSPWIGSKAPTETKVVGDIVFTDGSATPLGSPLDAEQKSKAIAVIFYVGTGLNSGDDTATSRTLGVGLAQIASNDAKWCTEAAAAYNKIVTTILCPGTEVSNGIYTFSGDKNGSDNLDQIAAFLGAENDTGIAVEGVNSTKSPEEAAVLYPAFYLAKNYKDIKIGSETESRLSGTAYQDGWYLPTVAELYEIDKARDSVNTPIRLCRGNEINGADFSSSTQNAEASSYITWGYNSPSEWNKKQARWLRAIREF